MKMFISFILGGEIAQEKRKSPKLEMHHSRNNSRTSI